jgi:hypothetical protein
MNITIGTTIRQTFTKGNQVVGNNTRNENKNNLSFPSRQYKSKTERLT